MKTAYLEPQCTVTEIKTEHVLCASGDLFGDKGFGDGVDNYNHFGDEKIW